MIPPHGVWRGNQRLRPLLDRHRPVQLAHRRPDAGAHGVRPPAEARRPAGPDRRGAGRAVRLARRHRPRPRHPQGRAARPGGRRARSTVDVARPPTATSSGSAPPGGCGCSAPTSARPTRSTSTPRRAGPAPPPLAAVPPQRHDLLRVRRVGPSAAARRPTTRSAAASSSTRTRSATTASSRTTPRCRYPFRTGDELLRPARETGLSITALMLENEQAWRTEAEIRAGLLDIWQVMQECVAARPRPGGHPARRPEGRAAVPPTPPARCVSEGDATRCARWTG